LVLNLTTGYVSPQYHLKFDDFFETVQGANTLPQSKWQQLSWFVVGSNDAPRQPLSIQGASNGAARNQVTFANDPIQDDLFDFDGGEEQDDGIDDRGDAVTDPAIPDEEPPADRPPDPERHRHPESSRRSTRVPKSLHRLIETAYAVLDDSDVEDYETQRQAEDPIAFAAAKSDPDTLNYIDAMKSEDAAEFNRRSKCSY
jgi:hypothetical protein